MREEKTWGHISTVCCLTRLATGFPLKQGILILSTIVAFSGCGKFHGQKVEIEAGDDLHLEDSSKRVVITCVDEGNSLECELRKDGKPELFFMVQKDRVTTSRYTVDANGNKWEVMDLVGNGLPSLERSIDRKPPGSLKFYGGEFKPFPKDSTKPSGVNN
jgi:hypothetical protein